MKVGSIEETITVTGASGGGQQNVRSQVYSHETLDAANLKAVSGFAALTPGVAVSGSLQDVGGNRAISSASCACTAAATPTGRRCMTACG